MTPKPCLLKSWARNTVILYQAIAEYGMRYWWALQLCLGLPAQHTVIVWSVQLQKATVGCFPCVSFYIVVTFCVLQWDEMAYWGVSLKIQQHITVWSQDLLRFTLSTTSLLGLCQQRIMHDFCSFYNSIWRINTHVEPSKNTCTRKWQLCSWIW